MQVTTQHTGFIEYDTDYWEWYMLIVILGFYYLYFFHLVNEDCLKQ